jgi:hemerythrin-like domain-containing protein
MKSASMHPIERLRRAHERLRTALVVLESALNAGPAAGLVLRNAAFSLSKQLVEHSRLEERTVTVCSRVLGRYDETMLARFALDHRQERQQLRLITQIFYRDTHGSWQGLRPTIEAFGQALRRTLNLQETQLFPLLEQTVGRPKGPDGRRNTAPLTETMTLNAVLQRYPQARTVLERYRIRLPFEQYDALDEVAWHHGVSSQELLTQLQQAIAPCLTPRANAVH